MKKQINQLIAIAEQYVETAKILEFNIDSHNHIRSNTSKPTTLFSSEYNTVTHDKPEIKLYFGGDWTTYSLDYGDKNNGGIDVIGYKNTIELPFDVTAKKLDVIIKDLKEVLIPLQKMESKAAEIAENKKKAEIESLEAKLKALKNDDDTK